MDGEKKGPVSKEQPEAQPVAAGPTKVGENSPKLDDVTALVGALVVFVTGAAAGPLETGEKPLTTITIKIAIENQIDLRFPLIMANIGPPAPH